MAEHAKLIFFPYTQVERLKKYIALRKELDQSEIAARINISDIVLRRYLNRSYHQKQQKTMRFSSVRALDRQIRDFLDQEARMVYTLRDIQPIFCLTNHAMAMIESLDYCRQSCTMRFIQAGTGFGKSYVFRHYQGNHDDVYYLPCNPIDGGSQKAFLSAIYTAVFGQRLSFNKTVRVLYDKLVGDIQGHNGLLIIDEVKFLNAKNLDLLCALSQEASLGILVSECDEPYYRIPAYENHSQFQQCIEDDFYNLSFPISMEDVTLFTEYHHITNQEISAWLHQRVNMLTTRYRWLDEITSYAKLAGSDGADINSLSLYQHLHDAIHGHFPDHEDAV